MTYTPQRIAEAEARGYVGRWAVVVTDACGVAWQRTHHDTTGHAAIGALIRDLADLGMVHPDDVVGVGARRLDPLEDAE